MQGLEGDRRKQLGALLRARRERLHPADVGLPDTGRRRTPGLRREEVAYLAGIGTVWYTWLEQGRSIGVSRAVLEAVARALRLTAAETAYALSLVGEAPSPALAGLESVAGQTLQALVDGLPFPAYLLGPFLDILASNRLARQVFVDDLAVCRADRNLVWLMFTHRALRQTIRHWDQHAGRVLGVLRAEGARHLGERRFQELVARLQDVSAEFRAWWPRQDVESRALTRKEVDHPLVGLLVLEQVGFVLSGMPDVSLVLYLPLPEQKTAAKLRRLRALERANHEGAGEVTPAPPLREGPVPAGA